MIGLLPFALGGLLACRPPPPPNVLLVTLDTTRLDAIGAYGLTQGESATPNIDALAASGVRFDRAYTVTPLTIPAHASLHTGLLPVRHQVRDNGDAYLSDGAVTLAERLQQEGYQTMASVGAEVTSHHWGFSQGFDAYYDEIAPSKENRWRAERPGSEVVDDALRWLDAAETSAPWFAWVHLFDAHFPYDPPEPFRGQWPKDPYRAEVASVDAQIGELIAGLPQDSRDRTWIFLLADHGESLGEHGESMHGVLLYDATTHIPLVAVPPSANRAAAGLQISAPVSIADLHPTILSIVGLEAKETDGFDISGVFDGSHALDSSREVYAESLYAYYHYGWAPQRAWIDGSHKLIDSTTPELYAAADRAERDNLAATDAERASRMKTSLDAYLATLTPAEQLAAEVHLSAEMTAQLQALGYVTGSEATQTEGPLPDPVRKLPVLRQIERARASLISGDLEQARQNLTAIVAEDPTLIDPQLMLAGLQQRMGDNDGAIATLEGLIERRRSSRVLLPLALAHLQRKEPDVALALLSEARDLDPYLPQTWHLTLSALIAVGDPSFPLLVREAASLLPEDVRIQGFLALDLALRGGGPETIEPLEAAIALGPQPLFHLGLARALLQGGESDAAEDALLEEVRLFPPAINARRALVTMYAEQARYEEQLEQLEAIIAHEEPSTDTFHSRAQALFNLRRYGEAKGAVDECRALAPSYPPCAMLDANALSKLGRKEEALAAYQLALALAGQSPK